MGELYRPPLTEHAAAKHRQALHRATDEALLELLTSFESIIHLSQARVPLQGDGRIAADPVSNERDLIEIHRRAAGVVKAAESLLTITSDLARISMLADTRSAVADAERTARAYTEARERSDQAAKELSTNINDALRDLEAHYYASRYKTDPLRQNKDPEQ
eukprot:m51a1_g14240 hypothetical protein (161) ;mRNA; r:233658-234302